MSERRPPTPKEYERIVRLHTQPYWTPEDLEWAAEMDKVIAWDISIPDGDKDQR